MTDEPKQEIPMQLWVVALQQNEAFKKIMAKLKDKLAEMQGDFFDNESSDDDMRLKAQIGAWKDVIETIERDIANTLSNAPQINKETK